MAAVTVTFEVPGSPVPKGRPRTATRDRNGNLLAKPRVYTPTKTTDYEQLVAWCARAANLKLEPGKRYLLDIKLHLSSRHSRSDLDNFCKAISDGLNQAGEPTGWDDRQIRDLRVLEVPVRSAAEEKAVVTIGEMSASIA